MDPTMLLSLAGALGKGGGSTKVNVSAPTSTSTALDLALSASVNPNIGISLGSGGLKGLTTNSTSETSAAGARASAPAYGGIAPASSYGAARLPALADIDDLPVKEAGLFGADLPMLLILAGGGAALFFMLKKGK